MAFGVLKQAGDVFNDARLGLRRCTQTNFACMAVGERVVDKNGVHALRDGKDQMFPAIARGDRLLACHSVEKRDDASF